MDAVVPKGHPMHIARPALPAVPFMTVVKGVAGFAVLGLCLVGAGAALMKAPFGALAQALATLAGAGIGGAVAWHTRAAKK